MPPIQLIPPDEPPPAWTPPAWWHALPAWLQAGVLVYVKAAGYVTPDS